MENTFMHTPPDYYSAICLALNQEAGELEIHDYTYIEEYDIWIVDCSDHNFHTDRMKLEGSFVRTCFKATKKGVTSWNKAWKET